MQLLGVDTGGTFTDFVSLNPNLPEQDIRIHKVLSTPEAPERAILQGIEELGLMSTAHRGELTVIHGSTVATNAALEGKGVRTAFISNRGFKDILTIGRQTRRELYNLQPASIPPPVPSELCLETGGRLAASGQLVDPLTNTDLQELKRQLQILKPEAVAINLLFSFIDSQYEKVIEAVVHDTLGKDVFTSRSSFVLPEYKEYERGMATWLNAWLGPRVERYLQSLKQQLSPTPVAVMQSSGGTIDADQASLRAVNMLLSGPAGGLAAAQFIGNAINSKHLLTFDMGGTSSDVAMIDGRIQLTTEGHIGHYPVAVPMVDMHTIGAGGGSIASLDAGGMLQVGPESAGASPGPACYGRGGQQPTVTDANAVLGRLRPDAFLGGHMSLDIEAAESALKRLAKPLSMTVEQLAEGILAIANEHMARALRVISVQRGYDPTTFQLCCFGGAGGLHVCALADDLNMHQIIVPIHGGVLSALGMLVAPRQRQLSRTMTLLLQNSSDQAINEVIQSLATEGRIQLGKENVDPALIEQQASLDLRYKGQSYTLNLPWLNCQQAIKAFHKAHERRYGHCLEIPVELVNVRVALNAQTTNLTLPTLQQREPGHPYDMITLYGFETHVPVYHRKTLAIGQTIVGPALITEQTSTTLIAPHWKGHVDTVGNLLINRQTTS